MYEGKYFSLVAICKNDSKVSGDGFFFSETNFGLFPLLPVLLPLAHLFPVILVYA